MKSILILVGAAALLWGTQLSAAPLVTGEAVVEWRHEPKETLIVDEELWRCAGNLCRGRVVETPHAVRRMCRLLARSVRLVSFSTPAITLGPDELQKCNG